jgi:hypothetical protein
MFYYYEMVSTGVCVSLDTCTNGTYIGVSVDVNIYRSISILLLKNLEENFLQILEYE